MDSETDTNYCYHGYHPGQEAVKGIVTAAGFFADEIAGAAAGAACASTGVGITVSGLCARSAMFVTNLGVGILENALNKVDKWPKH